MASRNTTREDVENSFYHVYARGASKQHIFLDAKDYEFFISLFKRYLSATPSTRGQSDAYPNYHSDIYLIAYCLMPNHYHLYIYQRTQGSLSRLMKGIMTSYSRYFNLKYGKSGSLFESRYKSARVTEDSHHQHITRYIHMNPRYWLRYPYSSLTYYLTDKHEEWLHPGFVMGDFKDRAAYKLFLDEYEENKSQLEELKLTLAK